MAHRGLDQSNIFMSWRIIIGISSVRFTLGF